MRRERIRDPLDEPVWESELIDQDKAKAEIVSNLMKKENLGMVSDVDNYELAQLSALKAVNARAKAELIDAICESILEYRVSHERKGRVEVVEITKNEPPQYKKKSAWKFWE